jgi:hypothetical protein
LVASKSLWWNARRTESGAWSGGFLLGLTIMLVSFSLPQTWCFCPAIAVRLGDWGWLVPMQLGPINTIMDFFLGQIRPSVLRTDTVNFISFVLSAW